MGVLKFIHIVMVYYSFHQVERLRVFNQICCAMRTHLHTMILKLRTQKIAEIWYYTHIFLSGVSSLAGVPGVPWHTQIWADQLTLSQPGWTDYAHLITSDTPGFSDLPTALSLIDKWINTRWYFPVKVQMYISFIYSSNIIYRVSISGSSDSSK